MTEITGTRFTLEVQPKIPERLSRLHELADNLLYSWENQITALFKRLDRELWSETGHNPKVFLRRVSQAKLETASQDRIFLENYDRAISSYDNYHRTTMHNDAQEALDAEKDLIAYFCAEFGFHESLPIYSGGLGILAGDHCKAASDLNIPFVAVGMLYRQGYFTQKIDNDGNQLAHYLPNDFSDLPISPARNKEGQEIHLKVPIQERQVELKVWQVKVGHIRLYLLDSDLPSNLDHDRRITYQLYGGDITTRIQQEIVLGIGGVKALRALGIEPTVWHINEGHAAFMIIERCREFVTQGYDFDAALELAANCTVFTTHTPVPAGHDIFDHSLILDHLKHYIRELNINDKRFLELGAFPSNPHGFNQTALAIRGSRFQNGVSRIHGDVASKMESYLWKEIPHNENPMTYVTNGVHLQTFLALEWINLFDMRVGTEWRNELRNYDYWERIETIPDHVYWSHHQSLKQELFSYLKHRTVIQLRRNGCSEVQIERLTKYIDPQNTNVLVIGFARRFATYKRAALLFSDIERLRRLLNDPASPIVFIFAGKAHPLDEPGQRLIKTIHEYSRMPEFEGKILVAEGYDIGLARKLVAGVDVWLNNPEYPLEASGTSGQKAGLNGVINLSVLDGWWGEGYNGENGWAIKPHEPEFERQFRDRQEGQDLLNILETQVIPLYFARPGTNVGSDDRRTSQKHYAQFGYSEGWVKMSKASMKSIIPMFNSQRQVMDYVNNLYGPASKQGKKLGANNASGAKELSEWKKKVASAWPKVSLRRTDTEIKPAIASGDILTVNVAAYLDGLSPSDVVVECLVEARDVMGEYHTHECHKFAAVGKIEDTNETAFRLELCSSLSGLQFYQIRIYPYHILLRHPFETGFMRWL